MLHTLPHCASGVDFPALLRLLKEGDALLLLQDGVTVAIEGNRFLESLRDAHITVYALKEDIDARGLVVKFQTVSSGLTILSLSDSRLSMPTRWHGDGGIVVYFLTPFRHRPKIRRPHIV